MNNDKEMTMVTLTMMVTVVIEASKLLAIVSLQAFKHILHQPTEIIKSLGIVFPKTIITQSHNVDAMLMVVMYEESFAISKAIDKNVNN